MAQPVEPTSDGAEAFAWETLDDEELQKLMWETEQAAVRQVAQGAGEGGGDAANGGEAPAEGGGGEEPAEGGGGGEEPAEGGAEAAQWWEEDAEEAWDGED